MDQDLVEEIDYLIDMLTKSGFFGVEEIIEILEDQFIEEDIDFSNFNISLNNFSSINFNKLENAFNGLAKRDIVAIHNCGYDIEEGVADAFELNVHLLNNKFKADGFCFYTFEDVVEFIFAGARAVQIGTAIMDEGVNVFGDINRDLEKFMKEKGYSSVDEMVGLAHRGD